MTLIALMLAAAPPPPAPSSAGVELRDEGTTKGFARVLNCTGTGVTCSLLDAGFGTIDVTGGGGGGGAPTTAQYWTGAADGTLSAEKNLGALGTGLVINTAGTPSAYAGASCTNQFPRSLSASGAATCASVDLSTDTAATVLPVSKGGTGAAPGASDQVLISTSTSAATWRTLPSCSNATTSKLLYDTTTDTFSCGTDQTGGGGGNFVADAFSFADSSDATKVVTAAWATAASNIICGPLGEEESVEDLRVTVIARASGSFTTRGYVPVGRHTGTMNFRCTGD